jgi:putative membrane protein insertion efficiency factor
MQQIAKKIIIKLINFYQKYISRDNGILKSKNPTCRFYPTCSEYTKQAVDKYGVFRGIVLGYKRIIRCNPWNKSENFDPLP